MIERERERERERDREWERELWEFSWRPDYTSELQATQRERKKRPSLSTWYFKRAADNLVTKVHAVMRLCTTIATVATRSLGKISLGCRLSYTDLSIRMIYLRNNWLYFDWISIGSYAKRWRKKNGLWIQRFQINPNPYMQLNSSMHRFPSWGWP